MSSDFYSLLGVSHTAPEREIKRAYHNKARTMHPDKASDPEAAKQLQEEFAAITKAYNTLKDPDKRAEYDAKLEKDSPSKAKSESKPSVSSGSGGDKIMTAGGDKRVEAGRLAIAEKSYNRGVHMLKMGDTNRALEFFETAVKNNPDEPKYLAKTADTLMKGRRGFSKAVELAIRACDLDPYNTEFKIILAHIYEEAGSKSLAIKTYENVLKWDQDNTMAQMKLHELKGKKKSSFFGNLFRKKS